jgi:hypothetical protein
MRWPQALGDLMEAQGWSLTARTSEQVSAQRAEVCARVERTVFKTYDAKLWHVPLGISEVVTAPTPQEAWSMAQATFCEELLRRHMLQLDALVSMGMKPLTFGQARVLRDTRAGLPPIEIARKLDKDASTISRNLDALRRYGYLPGGE